MQTFEDGAGATLADLPANAVVAADDLFGGVVLGGRPELGRGGMLGGTELGEHSVRGSEGEVGQMRHAFRCGGHSLHD